MIKRNNEQLPKQSHLMEVLHQIPQVSSPHLYTDDELEGVHCCTICRTEMKRIGLPEFSKKGWVIPSACKCKADEMNREQKAQEQNERRLSLERNFARSLMNEELKMASFDSFKIRAGSEKCFQAAKEFVSNFKSEKSGLLFFGNPGNGKSHLMAAIHHELKREGNACAEEASFVSSKPMACLSVSRLQQIHTQTSIIFACLHQTLRQSLM